MQPGKPTGHQIALLIIISWLLMVPTSRLLQKWGGMQGIWRELFDRYFTAISVAVVFLAVGPVRRACVAALSAPIGREHRSEVAIISMITPIHFFAFAGACAFWFNFTEGPLGLAQRFADFDSHAHAMAIALQPASLVGLVALVVVGPIVEEILFRAFLYRAWAQRYGWFAAMILASSLFAFLHPNFLPAFMGAIIFTCLYRRTGSLWAPITVHAAGNLLSYYPLLGQFVFPRDMPDPGDLQRWTWHVAALAAVIVIWPVYVWMSQDREVEPAREEMEHVALPR